MTFDEPDDIHVIDVTNTSIEVVWTSPSDDSVSMFSIYYAKVSVILESTHWHYLYNEKLLLSSSFVVWAVPCENIFQAIYGQQLLAFATV